MYESSGKTPSESTSSTTIPTESYVTQALDEMAQTLLSKSADYRLKGEFSNFEYAAAVASSTVMTVMVTQLGIKLGRLQGIRSREGDPNNESLYDTIKDLHGYAAILHAYAMSLDLDL